MVRRLIFPKKFRTWSNEKFNARWIDRGGPVSWVSRPLGLTLLDFFCENTLKEVCKKKVSNIAYLKERIEQEITVIKKKTSENVFDGIVKGHKFCIDVNSNTFEQ